MEKLAPITPGEILLEEFLKPLGLTQYRLAKEIDVPAQRISEIVSGKRSITADTDLRLCRFFGLSNGYWLRAQAAHDTEVAERILSPVLKKNPTVFGVPGPPVLKQANPKSHASRNGNVQAINRASSSSILAAWKNDVSEVTNGNSSLEAMARWSASSVRKGVVNRPIQPLANR